MAIYLPKQRIAIDVVDDPCRDAIDPAAFPGLTVLPLTCAELAHFDAVAAVQHAPAHARGTGGSQPEGDA